MVYQPSVCRTEGGEHREEGRARLKGCRRQSSRDIC